MKVTKRTPRTEMVFGAVLKHSEGLAETLAEALEVAPADVQSQLSTFIWISCNVEFENGDVDWQPASALDDEATLAAKFLRYMDSEIEPINTAARLITERDRPYDDELAPLEDTGDQGKKK